MQATFGHPPRACIKPDRVAAASRLARTQPRFRSSGKHKGFLHRQKRHAQFAYCECMEPLHARHGCLVMPSDHVLHEQQTFINDPGPLRLDRTPWPRPWPDGGPGFPACTPKPNGLARRLLRRRKKKVGEPGVSAIQLRFDGRFPRTWPPSLELGGWVRPKKRADWGNLQVRSGVTHLRLLERVKIARGLERGCG